MSNDNMPDVSIEINEEEIDHNVVPRKGIPLGVKIGMAGAVLFSVVAVLVVANIRNTDDNKKAFAGSEIVKLNNTNDASRDAVDEKNKKGLVKKSLVDDTIISELVEMDKKISDLVSSVELVSNDNAVLKSYDNHIENQIGSIEKSLKSINDTTINEMAIKLDVLAVNLDKLTKSVNYNKNKIHKITKLRPNRPPFMLLSIDQWNGVSSAVIELNGESTQTTIGDIRAGWRISSFIRPNCINVVRLSDSEKAKVCRDA